jgi:hypothetical protein
MLEKSMELPLVILSRDEEDAFGFLCFKKVEWNCEKFN